MDSDTDTGNRTAAILKKKSDLSSQLETQSNSVSDDMSEEELTHVNGLLMEIAIEQHMYSEKENL